MPSESDSLTFPRSSIGVPSLLSGALITAISLIAVASPAGLAGQTPTVTGGRKPISYPEAVRQGRAAAEAVLARSGAESCLRGKLNRALLRLSDSCAAHGERTELCELADKAAVVTPMNLAFMDTTASRLLELSD